ncbi:MAG: Gfo/Idh/MocA family oxidoreductase [Chloroflexales bacterium]|nr:Gfo/Idh/MocA family oxidoreductase [Chloroflexales bacterium]
MDEQKLRWGVISTANIGRRAVLPAIQRSATNTLIAVGSRDLAAGQAFAADLGIPRVYGSYTELLADPQVEAVYIPLPNSLHREWAIRAAEAGKHILCEKPLALSAAECLEMAEAARQHGVLLMEAFMYRFHPQTARALELLRAGAIGSPQLIRAAFSFRLINPANIRLQPDLGGGALMDVGCYCVNVSRTLFAAEPIEAQAFAIWSERGVDAQLAGSLRFADGRLAQIDCALTLGRRESYEVVGPEGSLAVPVAFVPGQDATTLYVRDGQGERQETVAGVDQYQLMVEHFAACVRGQATLRYPPEEAAANMRVIEALLRSARNDGRPEPIFTS